MADSFARGESSHQGMPEPLRSSQFPEIASTTTQVVLVMDGPKEFTIKPLKWALENISASGGIKVTLRGAMPRIHIPQKVPCSMAVIDENGEPVIIRTQPPTSSAEFTPVESPATFLTSPL